MKTVLFTVFSIFLISCSQMNSYSQSTSTEWPEISDVQVVFSMSFVSVSWLANAQPKDVYYEIERSTNGVHFKTVALVLEGFAAEQTYSYKFREKKKQGLKTIYRIKQIKQDGSFRIVAERSV